MYLKNVVEPIESYFCYCLKAHIGHYGAYSNSGHEGTNNALKHYAGKVTQKNNIENSLRILVNGSDCMMSENKNAVNHLFNTTQSRSKMNIYQSLFRYAAIKLEELVTESRRLLSIKINDHDYYVTRKE